MNHTSLRTSYGLALAGLLAAGTLFAVQSPVSAGAATDRGGHSAEHPDEARRGAFVSAEHVQGLTPRQVEQALADAGLDEAGVRHGVDAYRLVYRTLDPQGRPTTASGLVVLPRTEERWLRTVSYAHGTLVNRHDAPSVKEGTAERAAPLAFAGAGFAAIAPDYLGFGEGPGRHPWMHAESEAGASLDLLRAGRTFALRHGRILDRRILVSGFSQGGHAATALARQLAEGKGGWLRLGALAPVSGPYDMGGVQLPAMLSGKLDPYEATLGIAQWTVAWNGVYRFYSDPSEAFRAPYDQTVEQLFDGEHTLDEIFAELPGTPQELLTSAFLERLTNPTAEIAAAFRDNDRTCDMNPRVPTRLYAASGDPSVLPVNAEHCSEAIRARGGSTELVDLGAVDHITSEQRAVPAVVRWFSGLS
ncbi:hypothetical protein KEF29_29805 [Streptomyces tuirus]|uniref:Lipase n=1 Tax=Streptomyces tuirus TaxID=68278 RepID=A0A941FKR8_9ACTN|nr:hypothetical protein [Streptomyces tuirus]